MNIWRTLKNYCSFHIASLTSEIMHCMCWMKHFHHGLSNWCEQTCQELLIARTCVLRSNPAVPKRYQKPFISTAMRKFTQLFYTLMKRPSSKKQVRKSSLKFLQYSFYSEKAPIGRNAIAKFLLSFLQFVILLTNFSFICRWHIWYIRWPFSPGYVNTLQRIRWKIWRKWCGEA